MLLTLAWRNLWRNTKRTLILTASVFFAVVISLVTRSMQHGQYDYMIDIAVSMYTGAIQVQGADYWEKRTLEKSMEADTADLAWIASREHVTHVAPRLETFSLVAHETATKVSPVIGIEPDREDAMTGLRRRLARGTWLAAGDSGALIGAGLARMLGVDVGDSVVLYGQGFRGVTAAAQVRVQGILKFPLPDLDNAMVALPLQYAQWLYSAQGRLTGIAMLVDDPRVIDDVAADLRTRFRGNRAVLTWADMQPDLVQGIQADSASGIILLVILYIVIGFGILGTIMMMAAERRREFGILIAIGMRRRTLIGVTTLETVLISLLGAAAGIAAGVPLLVYMSFHPIPLSGELGQVMEAYGMEAIMPFSRAPGIFFYQGVTVLAIGLACALYPLLVLRELAPVAAMQGR